MHRDYDPNVTDLFSLQSVMVLMRAGEKVNGSPKQTDSLVAMSASSSLRRMLARDQSQSSSHPCVGGQ